MTSREHKAAVEKFVKAGYETSGFMKFVRSKIVVEPLRKSECAVVPDAWRYDADENVVYVVEVVKTHDLSPGKQAIYGQLWFHLDSEDGPDLRVVWYSALGGPPLVVPAQVFYYDQFSEWLDARAREAVDRLDYSERGATSGDDN